MYYSSELQLPESMSKSEKIERAEECIREMGLQQAIDTRIGGLGVKGLSGGQKRRLSICIEILTHPKLLFLDEPTSGLDSAASFYVMSRIARAYSKDGRTIIASIHQPSNQVFMLFDDLCLLSSGRPVYFGATKEANEFFSSNGFPCPSPQNPSDHFLQIINKDFDEYEDIEQGLHMRKSTEEIVSGLVETYETSQTHQQVRATISAICKENDDQSLEAKRENANFCTQCQVLTRRSFVNMYRDLGYYWLRLGIYVIVALGLGTVFFDLKSSSNSIQDRGSLLVYVAGFLTFMTIGGFPSFVEDMKVFKRERLNGHYGTIAFVIGNTLSGIPYLILVSLIPGTISYYLPGLQSEYQHFLYFILVIFSCMLLVESLMMIVASIVPNFIMGIIVGAGIQAFMMLGSGFFRLPNDLPRAFWRYPMYYISFHKFAYQGLAKNEFEGAINGAKILNDVWQMEANYSKWVDLGILFGMVFLYRLMFLIIVKTSEKIKPTIRAFAMRAPRQIIQVDT